VHTDDPTRQCTSATSTSEAGGQVRKHATDRVQRQYIQNTEILMGWQSRMYNAGTAYLGRG
jgi:hypothetical protein